MKETKVTDTLSEKSGFMFVGMLPIRIRPITLYQVEEMGELAEEMSVYDENEIEKSELISSYTFSRKNDVKTLLDVIIVSLFRRRICRFLFGLYVKKRIDSELMKICVLRIKDTFDFAFFFNASIFLRGMKKQKTEEEITALGDSWVES